MSYEENAKSKHVAFAIGDVDSGIFLVYQVVLQPMPAIRRQRHSNING